VDRQVVDGDGDVEVGDGLVASGLALGRMRVDSGCARKQARMANGLNFKCVSGSVDFL
jgi:hypothetical protein